MSPTQSLYPSRPPPTHTQPQKKHTWPLFKPQGNANSLSESPPASPPRANFSGCISNRSGGVSTCIGDGNTILINRQSRIGPRARDHLRDLVVINAMHTEVRVGCHPITRQSILPQITTWMGNRDRENNVLWVCGPAGIGKSAIAKTAAYNLGAAQVTVATASFFFSRDDPLRNNPQRLVLTLAYQLAVSLGGMGGEIDRVIEHDPLVLTVAPDVQWQKLVKEPVMRAYNRFHDPPCAIIIDGLDECGNEDDQRAVLHLISSCGRDFPFGFLVTSRTEAHLVNAFEEYELPSLCQPRIDLATCKDDQEMRAFVISHFSGIYAKHNDILKHHSSRGIWPSDAVIDRIVFDADGQYKYVSALFKSIDENGVNPNDRLLAYLQQQAATVPELDSMYIQIMQGLNEFTTQIQDLLFLACPSRSFPALSVGTQAEIEAILDLSEGQCYLMLRKLHSVIKIPKDKGEKISPHHRSFTDFLYRDHVHQVNEKACAVRILERCLAKLEDDPVTDNTNLLTQCWWALAANLERADITWGIMWRMERFDFAALGSALSWNDQALLISCFSASYQVSTSWKHSGLAAAFKKLILGRVASQPAQEVSAALEAIVAQEDVPWAKRHTDKSILKRIRKLHTKFFP